MGDTPEIPDACLNDDHDFDQTGRCRRCNFDRVDTVNHGRRTGGAGSLTHPLTDEEYRKEMDKLAGRE